MFGSKDPDHDKVIDGVLDRVVTTRENKVIPNVPLEHQHV
jgi:hypothetical protein